MRMGIVRHNAINESDAMTFQCVPGAEMVGTKPLLHAKLPTKVYRDGGNQPYGLGDFEWWRDYDVLDVPDFIYPWSLWFAEQHPNVWLTVWDNLPWNAPWTEVQRYHKAVRGYICRSQQAVNMVRYLVGNEKPIHLVPAGVDTELFSPAESLPEQFQALFVGRIAWEKGIMDMVYALRGLGVRGPEGPCPVIRFVGDGQFRPWLIDQGIPADGYVAHHALPDVYRQATLFLYPSLPTLAWQEQFGISVIEAMACGLPVIVSDSGALPELLPPSTRRDLCLIPAGRWDILRQYILEIWEHPGFAQVLGRMNRQWVEQTYSSEVVGKQLEAIYEA